MMTRQLDRESQLFTAVVDLVREVGYDRMTMDAVSAKAKVSKATIYRHWPGKPELVAEALRCKQVDLIVPADTGTLRGDLIELLTCLAGVCNEEGRLMAALVFAMQSDPELARLVRDQLMPAVLLSKVKLIDRAVARGEISADGPGRDLLYEMIPALLMSRFLVQGERLDDEFLTRVVDHLILPVLAR